MTVKENSNFIRLTELKKEDTEDYQPDLRNRPLLGAKGFKVGRITDLLIDKGERKVRYLDVEVENDEKSHILIPVGLASIHKEENYVIVQDLTKEMLDKHPAYYGEAVTRDYEKKVRSSFLPNRASYPEEWESDFYNHNHFNEHNLYGIRDTKRSRYMRKGDTQKLNWDRDTDPR